MSALITWGRKIPFYQGLKQNKPENLAVNGRTFKKVYIKNI